MKFGMFTLGPVAKAPESQTWDPGQEQSAFHEWLDQYEEADKLGYDYLFMGEHHYQSEYCHIPDAETLLAALTRRTSQARLGTTISHISQSDSHPVRVAERASILDILSDGRWEFGTGPANIYDGPQVYNLEDDERQTLTD